MDARPNHPSVDQSPPLRASEWPPADCDRKCLTPAAVFELFVLPPLDGRSNGSPGEFPDRAGGQ